MVTEIRPEPAPLGTVVAIKVAVDELMAPQALLKRKSFLPGVVSKFVPVTVTGVPTVPIVGVKLVTVGMPLDELTVNDAALDAEPDGNVTPIGPVGAPDGTVATNCVGADELTVAAIPLKVTVFRLGVWLKPVP